MKTFGMISTAAMCLLFANTAFSYPLPGQGQSQHDKKQGKPEKDKKQQGKPEKQQDQQAQKKHEPNPPAPQGVRPPEQNKRREPQRVQQVDNRNAQRKLEQKQKVQQVHDRNAQRKLEQQRKLQLVHDRNAQRQDLKRLSQQDRQQRIDLQQRNWMLYRQNLDQRMLLAHQQTAQLQQQRRMAQYRFQQDYYERLRLQQVRLQNERNYNYNNDPYYSTDWTYRYNRGGTYYQTNQYGADALRQAVNNGYREGFRAGQADLQDKWRSNYQDSYAYQDANFGYGGRYVQQDEYNYYFREGFQRGYEDGFNTRNQYGTLANGKYSVIGGILNGILNLQSIR